ncbi:hypothetical protein PAXRUDRAFT_759243 [Paxillus rubicundulus Ve08.2h10]|uniref:Uncharacterized protein n=1 Tax=Paxillus rubicundulus Ve08.2h10 TaxID=930991 RepID=A0A0D0DQ75_9AGAM|nr:hypothetical protein PAXRUDRAFT_759243 [Paxillus rubicundulus Ve08.2h10]
MLKKGAIYIKIIFSYETLGKHPLPLRRLGISNTGTVNVDYAFLLVRLGSDFYPLTRNALDSRVSLGCPGVERRGCPVVRLCEAFVGFPCELRRDS